MFSMDPPRDYISSTVIKQKSVVVRRMRIEGVQRSTTGLANENKTWCVLQLEWDCYKSVTTRCSERRLIGHWLTRIIKTRGQSTVDASITLDGVTLTESLIRWSLKELPSVYREIPVSAGKMFWTSNKPAQWTLYRIRAYTTEKTKRVLVIREVDRLARAL
jgi:hypothetical protein